MPMLGPRMSCLQMRITVTRLEALDTHDGLRFPQLFLLGTRGLNRCTGVVFIVIATINIVIIATTMSMTILIVFTAAVIITDKKYLLKARLYAL